MVLRVQMLHQCWLCWCSMHVRRCNFIICSYNFCFVSSVLSYEVSIFYDTCWIISPCRPPSSHNVHQYISCNIGATFRSIDVTEHRWYEYCVVPNIQALSSVLVNSQMDDEDGDKWMMVINKFHYDHEEAIRYKSTTLQSWPENAMVLIVGLILYCIVSTKTN